MIKYIDIDPYYQDQPSVKLIHPGVLEKTAEMDDELAEQIKNLARKEGKTYLLANAMGAGEYFGANRNLDYFPEDSLRKYHKTFEALANAYKHHQNKPAQGHKIYGKVVFSHYNENMKRVELIIEVDDKMAPDIVERINKGESIPLSMGCKIPYDVCSVCSNKAKTRAEYCAHIKSARRFPIDPATGKRAYLINLHPKFFDISFVTIPADRTAGTLKKLANYQEDEIKLSADIAQEYFKASGLKEADIEKQIEGEITLTGISSDPKGLIRNTQRDIPQSTINDLLKTASPEDVLKGMLLLRVIPTQNDFARITAEESERPFSNLYEFGSVHNNRELMLRLRCLIPNHSLTRPLVVIRILRAMMAQPFAANKPAPSVAPLGSSVKYAQYYKAFNTEATKVASANLLSSLDKLSMIGSVNVDFRGSLLNAPESYITNPPSEEFSKISEYVKNSPFAFLEKRAKDDFALMKYYAEQTKEEQDRIFNSLALDIF